MLERAGHQYKVLLSRHRALVREAMASYGGREHGTEGDSFFVSFDTPSDAVRAAVAAQHGLQFEAWPSGLVVAVRMGIHVGEVTEHDDGLVGMAVHHAARIAATANGAQVVVSDEIRALAALVADGITFTSRGQFRLRDVGVVELHQVQAPNISSPVTPLRANPAQRTNLPRSTSALVGRREELGEVCDLLGRSALVTLAGPGGVGKTTVALEAARSVATERDGGAWLVELGSLIDATAVPGAVAAALGVPAQPGLDISAGIVDHLSTRPTLLVLDNCEHVLDAARRLVEQLVSNCSALRVLATSRVPLRVRGERVMRLGPFDRDDDAVELFIERAMLADSAFVVEVNDREAIVEICRRLDGVPLAIELAAARVGAMSLSDIAARLDDRFRLLRTGRSDLLERHRTLRAVVDWSYHLLGDDERKVFERLSVFNGLIDLAAVEAVCDDDDLDDDMIDVMQSLVDRSMVVPDRRRRSTHYRMLETMRDYAGERLAAGGGPERWRDRHLAHYVGAVERNDRRLLSDDPMTARYWFDDNWDDVRGALGWATAAGHYELADRLVVGSAWFAWSELREEHLGWAERLLSLDGAAGHLSTAGFGVLAYWNGSILGKEEKGSDMAVAGLARSTDPAGIDTLYCWAELPYGGVPVPGHELGRLSGMLALTAAMRDPADDWRVLVELIDAAQASGDAAAMSSCLASMRDVADRVRAPTMLVYTELSFGHACLLAMPADPRTAGRHYLVAIERARAVGDARLIGLAIRALAVVDVLQHATGALSLCVEALAVLHDARYWQKLVQVLDSTALVLARQGRYDEAADVAVHLAMEHPDAFGFEIDLGFRDESHRLLDLGLAGWRARPVLRRDELVARLLVTDANLSI